MLCPLKLSQHLYPSGQTSPVFYDCEKENCAWWVETRHYQECAIKMSALAAIAAWNRQK